MKSTHGVVVLLVKLQTSTSNFTKVKLRYGSFSYFFNCTNGTKSRKASHLIDTLLIAIHNLLHAIISNNELQ